VDGDLSLDGFSMVEEFALDVDEHEADRSEYTASEERTLRLLGYENRVGIAIREPEPATQPGPGRAAYDLALMLVVHAHPECRFVWSRLVDDLTATPGAVIHDMVPDQVEDTAVEVETRAGAGLKFTTVLKTVDITASPELTRRRTVHFPTVTASGTGFHKAYWDSQVHATPENDERRARRIQSWQTRSPLPAPANYASHEQAFAPPPLSDLGRKLLGLDEWE
jgi:hypothetical protein